MRFSCVGIAAVATVRTDHRGAPHIHQFLVSMRSIGNSDCIAPNMAPRMAPQEDSPLASSEHTARLRKTRPIRFIFWGVHMFKRISILFSLSLGAVLQSHAAGLPAPTVEYSADRLIESDAGTFNGKVYSAKDRERTEMHMGDMQTVMILRRDKQVGWMLMPMMKSYQEMDLAQAAQQSGAAPDDQVEITVVGTESVEGVESTKYKMLLKDGSAGGFIWVTQQGIPVKMDMLSKSGRDKTRITMALKNLQIGTQDPQLFEIPAGYSQMQAFGVGAGKPGMKGLLKNAIPGMSR
jgi:hypothetical protein